MRDAEDAVGEGGEGRGSETLGSGEWCRCAMAVCTRECAGATDSMRRSVWQEGLVMKIVDGVFLRLSVVYGEKQETREGQWKWNELKAFVISVLICQRKSDARMELLKRYGIKEAKLQRRPKICNVSSPELFLSSRGGSCQDHSPNLLPASPLVVLRAHSPHDVMH